MTAERKSGIILAIIIALECGWVAAVIATAIFVALSLRLPSVRENLFRPSFLKLLAILLAIGAGILE